MTRPLAFFLLIAAFTPSCTPPGTPVEPAEPSWIPADVVVAWNARVLSVAEAEDGFLTLKGIRTAAMMHAAMHDALAMIEPRYEPFVATRAGDEVTGARFVDPVRAVNEAAYVVAVTQYPDREADLAEERSRWQGGVGRESYTRGAARATDPARAVGERSARAVLAARRDDGWDAEPDYRWHPMGPGVYAEFNEHSDTPEGFVFGAGWAGATPFMLDSPDQFRSPPPPDIRSTAYTRAFEEVKDVGAHESAVRTADQTHLAIWWKQFVEKSHNRLARELVVDDAVGLWDAARLFALLDMSIFDGYVASFDGKFFYNHWRPYTAIRWASNDGNADTVEDPEWTNLHDHTYAFPSYPSAHGTVCAAAMAVFEALFGKDRPFEMTIREADSAGPMSPRIPMDPPTRRFESFADAAHECAMSRVYLGIHFRYDSEEGTALGRKIGDLAVREFLTSAR